ncbi:MAG: hypothetical protein CMP45_07370 [Rickettsiales bacterium]|nr:hypothetical protein [Rickettsiales bacterium]
MKLFILSFISFVQYFSIIFTSSADNPSVLLGIDQIENENFSILEGKRVGLITNQTGVNSKGLKTRSVLFNSSKVNLVALYTPEHGLDGDEIAGKWVSSRVDKLTGLKAYSLYGKTRKPDAKMLKGVDVLVFDIQDVGARCYTYVSTMALCMEAAAENEIEFIVLDRPNPVGGDIVEGPPITDKWLSFVGMFPVPFRHGLTIGEIASMSVGEGWLKKNPKLTVIQMTGWNRKMNWTETGLKWVQTSPNIPRAESCYYYLLCCIPQHVPGMFSGIGTAKPFQSLTRKNFDEANLMEVLNSIKLLDLEVEPFSGKSKDFQGGVDLKITNFDNKKLVSSGIRILKIMFDDLIKKEQDIFLVENKYSMNLLYKVFGSDQIGNHKFLISSIDEILLNWAPHIKLFKANREKYLLYR